MGRAKSAAYVAERSDNRGETIMARTRILLFAAATLVFTAAAFAAPEPHISGAIWTATSDCATVDHNIYLFQQDVYLNGGPNNPNAFGLQPGSYWVKVTEPDGTLLGTSGSADFVIGRDGRPADCSYDLWSHLTKASDSTTGYDLTTNPGLEYKAWISTTPDFDNSTTKTDNFKVHNPHILVTQSCPGEAFVGDTITISITVTNTGSITLTNVSVNNSFFGALSLPDDYNGSLLPGQAYTWTLTCPASTAGVLSTTTTASGDDAQYNPVYTATSATDCATSVVAPTVAKTAATSYTRDWSWTLSKAANDSGTVTILPHTSAQVCYTLTASATYTDSAWAVSGSITVHNPATTLTATDASVADSIGSATVTCPGSAPYSIAPGGDLVCTYTASLAGAVNGTNTATATPSNN